ncbi:hypothetical protein [Verrucomicrobium spinosum]|nr:hypothetical protein [Verrucomicrobium spinosum]
MRNTDCPPVGHRYDGGGSLTGGTGEVNLLLGWLAGDLLAFPFAEIDDIPVESPADGRAALAAALSSSVDDLTVTAGLVDDTWEVQVNGDPVLVNVEWAIYTDGNPLDGGTHGGGGTMFAVDWV